MAEGRSRYLTAALTSLISLGLPLTTALSDTHKAKLIPGKFVRPDGAMVLIFPENEEHTQLATTFELVEFKSRSDESFHEFFSLITHYLVSDDGTRVISMAVDMDLDGVLDQRMDAFKPDTPSHIRDLNDENILDGLSKGIRKRFLADPNDQGDYDGTDGAKLKLAELLSFGFSSMRDRRQEIREAQARAEAFLTFTHREKDLERRKLIIAYSQTLLENLDQMHRATDWTSLKWAVTDGIFFVVPVGFVARGIKWAGKKSVQGASRAIQGILPEKLLSQAVIRTIGSSGLKIAQVAGRMDRIKFFPRFFARHWSGTLKTPGVVSRQFQKTRLGRWLADRALAHALEEEVARRIAQKILAEQASPKLLARAANYIFSKDFFVRNGYRLGYTAFGFGLYLKTEQDYYPDEFGKSQRFFITAAGCLVANMTLGFMAGRPLLKSMTINGVFGAGAIAGAEAFAKKTMPERKYAGVTATYFTTVSPIKTQLNRSLTVLVWELPEAIPNLPVPYGQYITAAVKALTKIGGWATIQWYDNSLGPRIFIYMQKEGKVEEIPDALMTLTQKEALRIETEQVEKHAARYLKMIDFVDEKHMNPSTPTQSSFSKDVIEGASTKSIEDLFRELDPEERELHNEFRMSQGLDPILFPEDEDDVPTEGATPELSQVNQAEETAVVLRHVIWLP